MMIVILVYCVVSVLMPTRPSLHLAFFAPPSTPLLSPQKILPICEFNGGPQWNLKIKRAQLLTIEKWDNLAIFKLVAVKQEIQIEPLQAAKAAARELWNVITQFFIRLFAWPDFFLRYNKISLNLLLLTSSLQNIFRLKRNEMWIFLYLGCCLLLLCWWWWLLLRSLAALMWKVTPHIRSSVASQLIFVVIFNLNWSLVRW